MQVDMNKVFVSNGMLNIIAAIVYIQNHLSYQYALIFWFQ